MALLHHLTMLFIMFAMLVVGCTACQAPCTASGSSCTCVGSLITTTEHLELSSAATFLSFESTQMTTIKSWSFASLTALQQLHVKHSPLSVLENYAFAGLGNLTSLLLPTNQITRIRNLTFSGLPNLIELDLSQNPITHIELEAFTTLHSLSYLLIANNHLSTLPCCLFKPDRPVLRHLDLSPLTAERTECTLSSSSIGSSTFSTIACPMQQAHCYDFPGQPQKLFCPCQLNEYYNGTHCTVTGTLCSNCNKRPVCRQEGVNFQCRCRLGRVLRQHQCENAVPTVSSTTSTSAELHFNLDNYSFDRKANLTLHIVMLPRRIECDVTVSVMVERNVATIKGLSPNTQYLIVMGNSEFTNIILQTKSAPTASLNASHTDCTSPEVLLNVVHNMQGGNRSMPSNGTGQLSSLTSKIAPSVSGGITDGSRTTDAPTSSSETVPPSTAKHADGQAKSVDIGGSNSITTSKPKYTRAVSTVTSDSSSSARVLGYTTLNRPEGSDGVKQATPDKSQGNRVGATVVASHAMGYRKPEHPTKSTPVQKIAVSEHKAVSSANGKHSESPTAKAAQHPATSEALITGTRHKETTIKITSTKSTSGGEVSTTVSALVYIAIGACATVLLVALVLLFVKCGAMEKVQSAWRDVVGDHKPALWGRNGFYAPSDALRDHRRESGFPINSEKSSIHSTDAFFPDNVSRKSGWEDIDT